MQTACCDVNYPCILPRKWNTYDLPHIAHSNNAVVPTVAHSRVSIFAFNILVWLTLMFGLSANISKLYWSLNITINFNFSWVRQKKTERNQPENGSFRGNPSWCSPLRRRFDCNYLFGLYHVLRSDKLRQIRLELLNWTNVTCKGLNSCSEGWWCV